MAAEDTWISPDQRIRKVILVHGKKSLKPFENCECIVNISDSTYDTRKYNEFPVIIGDSNDSFERLLDIVLTMMSESEKAEVIFNLKETEVNMILELKSFKSNDFIFEWNAKKKFALASVHKDAGVKLFKKSRYVDASHRFSKAIKLLASIPIPVDETPLEIDGIFITDIYLIKSNLYNNLASCNLKHKDYEAVIELCKRVLKVDSGNIKALYKLAIACYEMHDYDNGLEQLETLLKLDPDNKPAAEKLKAFMKKVNETNTRVNDIIKRMFI